MGSAERRWWGVHAKSFLSVRHVYKFMCAAARYYLDRIIPVGFLLSCMDRIGFDVHVVHVPRMHIRTRPSAIGILTSI